MSEKIHTVVALNGGIDESHIDDTRQRVATAVDLAVELDQTDELSRLILAGNDAEEMYHFARVYLRDYHPTEHRFEVEFDNTSRDTIGNAHFAKTKRHMDPSTDGQLHVVTVGWHMARSGWIFERVFGDDYDIHRHASPNRYGIAQTSRAWINEIGAKAVDSFILKGVAPEDDELREQRLLRFHPRYGNPQRAFLF